MSSIDKVNSLRSVKDDLDDDEINSIAQSIKSVDVETVTKTDHEYKQQLERSMFRTPGIWESKGSEKDIEDFKPIPTREKITMKWKLTPKRLKSKVKFENSSTKVINNQPAKLGPNLEEKFESTDILITDSSVQTINTIDKEIQAANIKFSKSVTEDKEMIKFQPLTSQNKALDDFLKKHVPNFVKKLKQNELYDLYRDEYKELESNGRKPITSRYMNVRRLETYLNPLSSKRYVSSHTWHPTIAGVFAVSYTTSNYVLYKSMSLKTSNEEITKTTVNEPHGISFGDGENNLDSWNKQPDAKVSDKTYEENIRFLLNEEFVQRMRIIQVVEDEKTNKKQNQPQINRQDILNTFVYNSSDYSIISNEDHELDDEIFIDDVQDEQMKTYSASNKSRQTYSDSYTSIEPSKLEDELSSMSLNEEDTDQANHHDSDTESFYNIWGDDDEWIYGNKLRNTVRNMHREFNKKYDREAKEKKMLRLLESEAKNSKKKEKIIDLSKERVKLTKDLFDAGDVYKTIKSQSNVKNNKKKLKLKKKYKVLENENDSNLKRENTPIAYEQSNAVIIWSVINNFFPKLRLDSPEEVCCIDFNPRNGNTIVGGLINGLICIWDITGKLEALDSNELSMSEKEINHEKHFSMHMQWSLNVDFKTRIRPTALTAILGSHDSMVTAIQWIHPMSQITHLGKFLSMPEGQYSMQFMSTSMDGTMKVWDLHSKLLPISRQKSTTDIRYERPISLDAYKSPLEIYHNRLMPTYTIIVKQSDDSIFSHITSMSFETSMVQYKCTSDEPLVIGKQQYEYVPKAPDILNRTIIVGNMMGKIGVLTWNGHDKYQEGGNIEECKFTWEKIVHNGPIICIKRNTFYPDIHIVCGGHLVSIWSLKYLNHPIWWKRFPHTINSGVWSTFHPLKFRLCFNNNGTLEFWNLMNYTNKPYHTTDIVLGDDILTLSETHSPMRFIDADKITFAEGIHQILNFNTNELISLSNHAGGVIMITIDELVLEASEIENIRLVIQKEISYLTELEAWNEKYTKEFETTEPNIVDNYDNKTSASPAQNISVQDDDTKSNMSQEQLEKEIRSDTYQSYIKRKGPNTRLGKMKEKFLEQEKRHMIDTFLKKKNFNEKQIEKYWKNKKMEGKAYSENFIKKLRSDAKKKFELEKFNQKINEFEFNIDSYNSDHLDSLKRKINKLLGTDYEAKKEKLYEYIKNHTYIDPEQNQDGDIIDRILSQGISIAEILKNPRAVRQKLYEMNHAYEDEEDLFE